ncbi:MAG: hypothetical protein JWO22_1072 [Frankiales bacterium]|nr:hypothetical protein [Frankiales bacterium]
MPTTVVRYHPKPGRADENAALVEKVMAELAETRPEGLSYKVFRLEDDTFVHVAEVTAAANPLFESPAFQAFTADLADRVQAPPTALPATLVGSYP